MTPVFKFAVLTDTHLNPEDATSSSPWRANQLANRRAAAIVAQINALKPAFVIHLGDVVHPVPGQPGFDPAVARFRAIFGALEAPLRCLPGNHDIGDKPTDWMPAPVIAEPALELYRAALGPDRQFFDHAGCRFVLLNAMLINSGLAEEALQWAWLETALPAPGTRCFVFLHYPPFLLHTQEPEHYDNLAEPGRARLLALFRARGVEAVFSGHVHNIFVNRADGTDFHVLPATSAVRHDYSELFPVPPPDAEHGRDNVAKLGFYLVEVFADRHAVHWVRSWGATDTPAPSRMPRLHPRSLACPLGVDLRHDWARPITLPYTGVVDEFSRKQVRNDYLTMQMAGLGLRHLRVPLQDAQDPMVAERMAQLADFGHRFTVCCFGLPDLAGEAALAGNRPAIERVEVVLRADHIASGAAAVAALGVRLGLPVHLSRLNVSGDASHHAPGARYAHFIRTGFAPEAEGPPGLNLAYRIERAEPLWPALAQIGARGRDALVHLRLAATDPAEAMNDEAETARRVADAVLAAKAWQGPLTLMLDTLMDHDRGYFPRLGLLDRRADPRAAGRVLIRLTEWLAGAAPFNAADVTVLPDARVFPHEGGSAVLWLPATPGADLRLPEGMARPAHTVPLEDAPGMPQLLLPHPPD